MRWYLATDSRMLMIGGPSGVGKSTVFRDLIRYDPERFLILPRVTTRLPRSDETVGIDYHYISLTEFEKCANDGQIISPHEFNGNLYGIYTDDLKRQYAQSNCQDHIVISAAGYCAMAIRLMYPNSIYLYLTAPEEVLRQRLKDRGDNGQEIEYKLSWAKWEHREVSPYVTHSVSNDRPLEETIAGIYQIIDIPVREQVESLTFATMEV